MAPTHDNSMIKKEKLARYKHENTCGNISKQKTFFHLKKVLCLPQVGGEMSRRRNLHPNQRKSHSSPSECELTNDHPNLVSSFAKKLRTHTSHHTFTTPHFCSRGSLKTAKVQKATKPKTKTISKIQAMANIAECSAVPQMTPGYFRTLLRPFGCL